MSAVNSDMRQRANQLLRAFAANIGEFDATFDHDNDRSFGEFGFHYDAEQNLVVARVYIADAYLRGEYAKPDHFRRVLQALNDPNTSDGHERGGGEFELDEDKEMYFLVRKFPIETTSSGTFRKEMETLINAGAAWSMKWFVEVVKAVNQSPKTAVQRVGAKSQVAFFRRGK